VLWHDTIRDLAVQLCICAQMYNLPPLRTSFVHVHSCYCAWLHTLTCFSVEKGASARYLSRTSQMSKEHYSLAWCNCAVVHNNTSVLVGRRNSPCKLIVLVLHARRRAHLQECRNAAVHFGTAAFDHRSRSTQSMKVCISAPVHNASIFIDYRQDLTHEGRDEHHQ
jgi:hypothetical protein